MFGMGFGSLRPAMCHVRQRHSPPRNMLRRAIIDSGTDAPDTQQTDSSVSRGAAHPQPAAGRCDRREADLGDPPAAVQAQHLQVRVAGRQRRHPRVRHAGAPVRWRRGCVSMALKVMPPESCLAVSSAAKSPVRDCALIAQTKATSLEACCVTSVHEVHGAG